MNVHLLGQPAKHNSDHRDVNPSFGMWRFDFIVAHQTTMLGKPAKGSFNQPALGQHAEATPALVPMNDFQPQRARFAMGGHPGGEIFSGVTLVGPQATQPVKAGQRLAHKAAGTLPLRHIGFGDTDPEQQSQRIHQDVTLNPLGFLGRIVAGAAAAFDIGGKRIRYIDTPHVPHGWDAGVIFDETTGTLFCGDLFARTGNGPPLTGNDIVGAWKP